MLEGLNTGYDGSLDRSRHGPSTCCRVSRRSCSWRAGLPLVAVRSQIGAAIDAVVHVTRSVVGVVQAE
jgi:hypothetical protein